MYNKRPKYKTASTPIIVIVIVIIIIINIIVIYRLVVARSYRFVFITLHNY